MDMDTVFAKIDAWERAEIKAAAAISSASAADVERFVAIKRKWAAMRDNVMKTAFNAQQFNRRSDWMRKTNRSADEAAAMFPVTA